MDALIQRRLLGVWRVADPKITLASVAAMLLGACAAARDGSLSGLWLTLTVLATFCIEAAKNASGEVFDFDSGTDLAVQPEDRSPFSGGKRVLVDGLLTRRETFRIAAVFYALGAALGLAIVVLREPAVLWLGLVGVALAWSYHAPPLQLSYRGLGELAVAVTYGPLILCGTYLVQRQTLPWEVALLGVPLGIATGAFLWVNEFPDYCADRSAGKRTWVVRLGRARAAPVFAVLVACAWLGLLLLPLIGFPWLVWLGLVGLPPAIVAARRLLRAPEDTREIVPAQGLTLVSFVLMALGAGLGLVLAP